MRPVLVLENVSKVYPLKDKPRLFFDFLFKKSKRIQSEKKALDHISFSLNKGDILGVIGNNGAGKSTLLKLLSQVTIPSSGKIVIEGNISSLLEIGTGFHPDLTGLENIYMNGSLLGMTKKEIENKLIEIIHFSGVEEFIDQPIRNYSSGMMMRLAFSIAANLDNDILLLDEIFAVGDLDFRKKSINKIEELFKKGKTIVYVSHDLDSVRKLCTKCLYLSKGEIQGFGEVESVINQYRIGENIALPIRAEWLEEEKHNAVHSIAFLTDKIDAVFHSDETITIEVIVYLLHKEQELELNISCFLNHQKVFMLFGSELINEFKEGENRLQFNLPKGLLNKGLYHFNLVLHNNKGHNFERKKEAIYFRIVSNHKKFDHHTVKQPGLVNIDL